MYIPSSFAITDKSALLAFMHQHPLGLCVSHGPNGFETSPLPFLYQPSDPSTTPDRLIAHMARANSHWRMLETRADCVVLFQAAQGYITPTWYPSKAATHKEVPTWNYSMVEVQGTARIHHDAAWLHAQIEDLTAQMESVRAQPWAVSDAPQSTIATLLRAVVGVEIQIHRITGKAKLSQNKPAHDVQGVIDGLAQAQDPHHHAALAQAVEAAHDARTKH